MEGLTFLGTIPARHLREEYVILTDQPVYDSVKDYASNADMQEIDGWARSFYTLEGILDSIQLFSKPLIPEPTDSLWDETKQEVFNEISNLFTPVTSLSFETGFDSVPYEHSSAAGYGYTGKKGEGDNLHRAKAIANKAVLDFSETIDKDGFQTAVDNMVQQSTPDVAFTRTQLAKLPSIKVRIVFGEAFHFILIEGLSAAPLLEAFKRTDSFYFTGKDPTIHVPQLIHKMGLEEGWFVCLDWKSFDSSVQLWEIDFAFSCVESLLTFPSENTRRAFYLARESFKHRKLAAPDCKLWMRKGGIPSGSYFTNIIGSIINYTRITYVCKRLGLRKTSCYVQGDDSVTFVQTGQRPDLYQLQALGTEFGWSLNIPKCTITQSSHNVTFLGRSQVHQLNTRERLKVLRLMCFPEFKVEDPKISTARVKAIARDAGWNDPLYTRIYLRLSRLYGEVERLPPHLMTYVDRLDFQDVNM
uniref:RNA-dependent RNA polymerase n=1 Tax=Spinach deltapartitivirus 1 TaxID=1985163 RepID=A0A1W6S3U7_9VIRU|nr:RNA-dependent RNA polymerase [Spinach deltapartitivirus 1]